MQKRTLNLNQTLVKDVMRTDIISIDSKEALPRAARLMIKNKVHGIIVTKNGKPQWIITTFDLIHVVYLESFSENMDFIKSPIENLVKDQDLITIGPDTSVKQALNILTDRHVHSLPVEKDGEMIGIFSLFDTAIWITGKQKIQNSS